MSKPNLTILLLLCITLAASGCINGIGGEEDQSNQIKIEEGDTLVYNTSGEEWLADTISTKFIEINDQDYRIQVLKNTEVVTNTTLDRDSLETKDWAVITRFPLSVIAKNSNISGEEIRGMMEKNDNITVSNEGLNGSLGREYSESNLWRGQETEINGFEAYEIFSDQGLQDTEIFVLGSEPYPTVRYRSEDFRVNLESIENKGK
jgi:hypothetical protein